jgi:hypothetical protein
MKSNGESNLMLAESANFFGRKIGLVATLFGCWHKNLSRPFTYGKESYRVCLNCGARKDFNAETFTTSSSFYYPPKPILHDSFTALK